MWCRCTVIPATGIVIVPPVAPVPWLFSRLYFILFFILFFVFLILVLT